MLNNTNQKKIYRWVLLRHIDAPNDSQGIHFDLLLEDQNFCRTWRLSDIPLLDGPYVEAIYTMPHKLYWLDIQEKIISDNRGVATRIKKGIFLKSLPCIQTSYINSSLFWEDIHVDLVIDKKGCRINRKKIIS